MKYKEVSFVLGCIVIIFVGGFFLLPKVFKEFQDEEVIRVRVALENKCSITDDAFVGLTLKRSIIKVGEKYEI